MVVGPRYIPGSQEPLHEIVSDFDGHGWAKNTDQVPDASRITPPVQPPGQDPLNPVSLTIDLAPGFPVAEVSSSYHPIQHTSNDQRQYHITLQEGSVPANRDFELTWKPEKNHEPQAALFTEHHDEHSYALLMIVPPTTSNAEQISIPRDVTFVIDTSGSMHGTSIEQARLALNLALTRLQPLDQFNIIQFNNTTQALFPSSQPVTFRTIQQASQYINNLVAEGGTEMLPALQRAFQRQETSAHLQQVIFITDGQVGNEEQLFRTISQDLSYSRLFTVGIGSAPNSYFMRKAAKFGRGTFTYIGSVTEVKNKMDRLFQKLEHPVVTDIALNSSETPNLEVIPTPIPDLYLGEPVMIALSAHDIPERISINGRIGQTPWTSSVDLDTAPERHSVAVYWARQKIASLMDNVIEGKDKNIVRESIIDTAIKHHLVSRYTSLVAIDVTPTRPFDRSLSTHAMKTILPHGQDYTAIFGLSAGATPAPWHVTIGLLLLLMASAGYRWTRGRP